MSTNLRYRYILGGACLGEVLGSPFEFQENLMPPPYGEWVEAIIQTPIEAWGQSLTQETSSNVVGRTGDDVYFTLALGEALLERNGFDPKHTSNKFQEAVQKNNLWGLGGASYNWYQKKLQGLDYRECAAPDGMAGGGPVMRYIPVALFNLNDSQWIIETSIGQARVTHIDRRCSLFGASASLTLSSLLKGENSFSNLIESLIEQLAPFFPERISFLKTALQNGMDWDKQYQWLSTLGIGSSTKGYPWLQERLDRNPGRHPFFGGYAPVTFLWPLCLAFKHQGNFFASIHENISCGGDTDTTSIVLGSFCCALHKKYDPLIEKLIPRIDKSEQIARLADDLASYQSDR